jgi:hypothetical protein
MALRVGATDADNTAGNISRNRGLTRTPAGLLVLLGLSLCLTGCGRNQRTPRQKIQDEQRARNPVAFQGVAGLQAASDRFHSSLKDLYADRKTLLSTTRYKVVKRDDSRLFAGQAFVRYIELTYSRNGDLTNVREVVDRLQYANDRWKAVSSHPVHPKDPTGKSTLLPAPVPLPVLHYLSPARVEGVLGKPQAKKVNGGAFGEWRTYRKAGVEQVQVRYVKDRAVETEISLRCGGTRPEQAPQEALKAFGVTLPLEGDVLQSRIPKPAPPVVVCEVSLFYQEGAPYYRLRYALEGAPSEGGTPMRAYR